MKAKTAICAVAAICAFVTVPAGATLTVIGTATYDGADYNLVWDDDNGGGTDVVYLDYDYSVGRFVNHPDAISWAGGLGATLTINLLPGHAVTWSGDWRLPAPNAGIELGDLDNAECPDAQTLMDAWPAPAFNRFWVGMSPTGQIYQQPGSCGPGGSILQHDNPNEYDNGAIAVRSASMVITEPGAIIKFELEASGDIETVTPAELTVLLVNPEPGQTYTVDYAITGGSATGCGVDYHSLFSPCYPLDLKAIADNWLWTGAGFNRADLVPDGSVDLFDFSFFAGQFLVEKGTMVFLPGQTSKTININIMDDNKEELNETIEITLSNPTGPDVRLGTITQHTYTIIDPSYMHLKVDLGLPTCDSTPGDVTPVPGTVKDGWWGRVFWGDADMYMHDFAWEDGSRGADPPNTPGIDGSGVHFALDSGVGDGGYHVHGMCRDNLGGGGCPTGAPLGEPIANGWFHNIDWGGECTGDIHMRITDLPPGRYELISYHNHWEPCDQGTRNCLDCYSNMPPMTAVYATSLPVAGLPGCAVAWTGTGTGVTSLVEAYDVDVTSALNDADVATSTIEFETDGSDVLVVYDGGDNTYPDPARPEREGSKGILNAFEIIKVGIAPVTVTAWNPFPDNGADGINPVVDLSWMPGSGAVSHDVYFGTDSDAVGDANTSETLGVYMGRQDACEYDPVANLELGQTYYWRIDEVNGPSIYEGSVWSFTVDEGKACCPSPDNGSTEPDGDVTLSWSPGIVAASHDVYFGTDFAAVSNAGTLSPEYKGNQALASVSYDPPGLLDMGQAYYWRIDEVNPGYADSKGDVWNFQMTISCLTIDDMESYCLAGGCWISDTWIDYYTNGTGSLIYLETSLVHGGSQSMRFNYDNDILWGGYSETERSFED
ncbi:MAG: Calx-beta domain-containing protein, partial [Planctomycetota bacterium]